MKSEREMIEKAAGQEVACGLEEEVRGMEQRLENRYFGGYREYLTEYNPDVYSTIELPKMSVQKSPL